MRKILAFVIAIVMVMTLVPSFAFAEGAVTTQEDLIAAIADANTGTITLSADITLEPVEGFNGTLVLSRDLTLDLGGYTLASADATGAIAKTVLSITGGTVIIQNGTIRGGTVVCKYTNNQVTISILSGANVTMSNVNVYGSEMINTSVGGKAIDTRGDLSLNSCYIHSGDSIKDASLFNSDTSHQYKANAGCALYADGCNLTITNSTIKGGDGITKGTNEAYPNWNSKRIGDGANLACGSVALEYRGNKKLTITDSRILGGNSSADIAGDAISGTGTADISGSYIHGGNAFGMFSSENRGIGGSAIGSVAPGKELTLTDCFIKGGDAGNSWIGYGIESGKGIIRVIRCFIGGGDISEGGTGGGKGAVIYPGTLEDEAVIANYTFVDSVLYANEKAYNNGRLIDTNGDDLYVAQALLGANAPTTLACAVGTPKLEHIKMIPSLWAEYIEDIIADEATPIEDTVETLASLDEEAKMEILSEGEALEMLEEAYTESKPELTTVVTGSAAEGVTVVGAALSVDTQAEVSVTPHLFIEPAAAPTEEAIGSSNVQLAEGTKLVPLSIKLYDSIEKANPIPLKLPVKITMPIPQGLNNANRIAILHYDDNGVYKGIIYPDINAAANTMTFLTPSFSTFTVVNVNESRTDESHVTMGVDPTYVVVIPSTVEFGTLAYDASATAYRTGFFVKVEKAFIAKTATITVTASSDYAMENGGERINYVLYKNAEDRDTVGANAAAVNAEAPIFATFGYGAGVTAIDTTTFEATVWGCLSCKQDQIRYAGSYSDTMTFTITYNP